MKLSPISLIFVYILERQNMKDLIQNLIIKFGEDPDREGYRFKKD